MVPKNLLALGVGILTVGVAGLGALTAKDVFFPKPAQRELRQTKSMLRNVFEKNKELTTEVEAMTLKQAEFMKKIEDKEKELNEIKSRMEKQAAYVRTLSKQGERLEKEVSQQPATREYVLPRQEEPVEMAYTQGFQRKYLEAKNDEALKAAIAAQKAKDEDFEKRKQQLEEAQKAEQQKKEAELFKAKEKEKLEAFKKAQEEKNKEEAALRAKELEELRKGEQARIDAAVKEALEAKKRQDEAEAKRKRDLEIAAKAAQQKKEEDARAAEVKRMKEAEDARKAEEAARLAKEKEEAEKAARLAAQPKESAETIRIKEMLQKAVDAAEVTPLAQPKPVAMEPVDAAATETPAPRAEEKVTKSPAPLTTQIKVGERTAAISEMPKPPIVFSPNPAVSELKKSEPAAVVTVEKTVEKQTAIAPSAAPAVPARAQPVIAAPAEIKKPEAPVLAVTEKVTVKETAVKVPATIQEKVPEPKREGGEDPIKPESYQQVISFEEQMKQLRVERSKAEEVWEKRIRALEADIQSRLPEEERVKMEKQIEMLQDKSKKLTEKLSSIKRETEQDRVDYLYNLGVAYTQAGLYDAAAEMYEKVLKIAPDDAASHYNLGILYDEHLNRVQEGIDHYKAYLAISRDPDKRRDVQNWIRLSEYKVDKRQETFFDSASKAAKHLLLTTPD